MTDLIQESLTIKDKPLKPILLPPETSFHSARLDFADRLNTSAFTLEDLEDFVNKCVKTVQIGNAHLTVINQEHERYKGSLNPILKAYVTHPRTKTVVVEYFLPELQRDATNIPFLGNKALGEITTFNQESGRSMFMFMDIAELCKLTGKTVTCVDIANKISYEGYYVLMKGSLLASLIALLPQIPISPVDRLILGGVVPVTSWLINSLMEAFQKGQFNKEHISLWENFLINMEDGRRVYAAKGLEKLGVNLTKEHPSTKEGGPNPQAVVVYPKAHARRIINYLINPTLLDYVARSVKQVLYYLPNLDYRVRTYSWKDTLARLSGDSRLAGWQLTSSYPLTPL